MGRAAWKTHLKSAVMDLRFIHIIVILFYPVLFSCLNMSVNRPRVEFNQGCCVSSLERYKRAEGLCKRTRVTGHKSKPEVRTEGYEDRKSVKGDNVNS